MKYDQFRAGLYLLHDEGSIRLPFDVPPSLDESSLMTPERWNDTPWNPPAGHAHLTRPDSAASEKPTYGTVETATERLTIDPEMLPSET